MVVLLVFAGLLVLVALAGFVLDSRERGSVSLLDGPQHHRGIVNARYFNHVHSGGF